MGNPTMWFEVAARDHGAMKDFYASLFDWELVDMEEMPYATVQANGAGIPGGIGAAPEGQDGHVTFYVEVDDVGAALGKVESMGGSRVMEPTAIPKGEIALFADPEGHVVGLMHMNSAA